MRLIPKIPPLAELVLLATLVILAAVIGGYATAVHRPHEVSREWRLKNWTQQEREMYWKLKSAQEELREDF